MVVHHSGNDGGGRRQDGKEVEGKEGKWEGVRSNSLCGITRQCLCVTVCVATSSEAIEHKDMASGFCGQCNNEA